MYNVVNIFLLTATRQRKNKSNLKQFSNKKFQKKYLFPYHVKGRGWKITPYLLRFWHSVLQSWGIFNEKKLTGILFFQNSISVCYRIFVSYLLYSTLRPISTPESFNRYGTVWYVFCCSQEIFLIAWTRNIFWIRLKLSGVDNDLNANNSTRNVISHIIWNK